MKELDELLKHHGVKGMHWGSHHGAHGSEKPFKESGKLSKRLDSLKRERSWSKHLKNIDNMSTKDINALQKRVAAENTFKALTKHKVATEKDKEDYRRRHEMDDQELQRKINRLSAKKNLHEAIKNASKEQREAITKVGQTAATIGANIALNGRPATKAALVKGILDAAQNPTIKTKQNAWDVGVKIASGKAKNPKVTKALEIAKDVKVGKAKS